VPHQQGLRIGDTGGFAALDDLSFDRGIGWTNLACGWGLRDQVKSTAMNIIRLPWIGPTSGSLPCFSGTPVSGSL